MWDGVGCTRRARNSGAESVLEGEPHSRPEGRAGVWETVMNSWKDSELGCGWEGCGQHSVGSVILQALSSRNFNGMKLLEPFPGLIPRV